MFRFYSDFADSAMLMYFLGHVFVISENTALERSWLPQTIHTCVTVFVLCCFSPCFVTLYRSMACEDGCKSSPWEMSYVTDVNYFLSCMLWQKQ